MGRHGTNSVPTVQKKEKLLISYEFCFASDVGGWGNTKTAFRNCKQCQIECEVEEPLLNCDSTRRYRLLK